MRVLVIFIVFLLGCQKHRRPLDKPVDIEREIAAEAAIRVQVMENDCFRNIGVDSIAPGKYNVSGQARVYEAAFSWIVEDGRTEVAKGIEMTDAGAPEWGNFSFEVPIDEEYENSNLNVVLYEPSPLDGRRTHELSVPLTDNQ